MSEKDFADEVEEELNTIFGEENVERQKYLEESGRFVDFWAEGMLVDFAIEVEDSFESIFNGVSQATLYAEHGENVTPVVILPEEAEVQEPEREMLSHNVSILQLDV